LTLDLGKFKSALLKGSKILIPNKAVEGKIPHTYVPYRNVIFLSIAFGFAESKRMSAVYYGANAVDYSGYPDCRPEFVEAYSNMSKIINPRIDLITPLLSMSKQEIVEFGNRFYTPFHLTWSCYRGGLKACGKCPSCELRLKGFKQAGLIDPIEYE